jgi:hypothetical protein
MYKQQLMLRPLFWKRRTKIVFGVAYAFQLNFRYVFRAFWARFSMGA